MERVLCFLVNAFTLPLIWSASIAAAVNMPPEEPLIFPPTNAPPTEGQKAAKADLAKLIGPPVKEITDSKGNTILTITTFIGNEPIALSTKIGKKSIPEQTDFEKGFFYGYAYTIKDTGEAVRKTKMVIDPNYQGTESRELKLGFLAGVYAGIAALDLIQDTQEALGIQRLPSRPPG